jgi:hypothetical protein
METKKEESKDTTTPTDTASRALFIKNFLRPFSLIEVKELLSGKGKVVQWGMDANRSKCWVIVSI